VLYLLYISRISQSLWILQLRIYNADDTAILVAHNDHIEAYLQESLSYIQRWLKKWRIKADGTRLMHVTSIKETCPSIILNSLKIPQAEDAKYLLHLEHRLEKTKNILTKQKLGFQLGRMYWLLGSKS